MDIVSGCFTPDMESEAVAARLAAAVTELGDTTGQMDEDGANLFKADFALYANLHELGASADFSYDPKMQIDKKQCQGADVALALYRYNCGKFLEATALLAKHIAKISKLYTDMGPVKTKQGGKQVTRASLKAKITAATTAGLEAGLTPKDGIIPLAAVDGFVNNLMCSIGKEKVQSGMQAGVALNSPLYDAQNGEQLYVELLKTLCYEESDTDSDAAEAAAAKVEEAKAAVAECEEGSAELAEAKKTLAAMQVEHDKTMNWHTANWGPIDKAQCPGTMLLKGELDKLGTSEFGISAHEMRLYFFETFYNMGEAGGLKQIAGLSKWVGGEVAADEEALGEEPSMTFNYDADYNEDADFSEYLANVVAELGGEEGAEAAQAEVDKEAVTKKMNIAATAAAAGAAEGFVYDGQRFGSAGYAFDKTALEEGDDTNTQLALMRLKVAAYFKGAVLLTKHIALVRKFFVAMGPEQLPRAGLQVTRASLTRAIKGAGVVPANRIGACVNSLMESIGKEKPASAMVKSANITTSLFLSADGDPWTGNCEDFYAEILKKLATMECGEDIDNWDSENWKFKDASLCPGAQMVKADLDKLNTNNTGINQHENRFYWFEQFMNLGEANTLQSMGNTAKWVGMAMSDDDQDNAKEARRAQLSTAFDAFDTNGDGVFDKEELKKILCAYGGKMSDEKFEAMWAEMDEDESDSISKEEYIAYTLKKIFG